MRTDRPTDLTFGKFQMAISPQGVVRSTSCLVLRWGFRGWLIEWRYFRFCQIQDGGSAEKNKNNVGSAWGPVSGSKNMRRQHLADNKLPKHSTFVARTCNLLTECATSRLQQVAVDSNKLHVWAGLDATRRCVDAGSILAHPALGRTDR